MRSYEKRTINTLESNYMSEERLNIYTSLEDIEEIRWHWSMEEINVFESLWKQGKGLVDIAAYFNHTELSILLLSLDRLAKGEITRRSEWKIR
ncbi:hypothetical protein [Mesobacillus stamsii]|uniref:Helix-turn-helix domain containing protein n=1 Tax=Mesobacillus stamsii TaxID=225347 RepID=A0ABU0FW97_9BACI|nr:hypothetical protein [Mesobacillus stamsii]MDQ0414197.1 hypothetical protein [Mesobacillus stamsii]